MRPILALALLAACTASAPLPLPIEPTDGSLLFAVREENEKPRIFAFSAGAIPPLTLGKEELLLISYPFPLDRLGLEPGEQQRPGDSDPARPLPPGYTAYRASEDRSSWSELTPDDLDSAIGERVLMDVENCEVRDGCIRRREATEHEFCELPCKEPLDPQPPMPPTAPMLPDFKACPRGWMSVPSLAADTSYCEPPPIQTCPPGQAHFLGDASCSPIGAACPQDGWPAQLPSGRTIRFVRSGSSGDGSSRASPLGTIAAAISAAEPLDVIALYAGTHAGGVVIDRSIAIMGACADTVISGGAPALRIDAGARAEISDLTIAPSGDGISAAGNAVLDGVAIVGGDRGVFVTGGLAATSVLIRDAREGGALGIGQAELRFDRAVFADNVKHGVRADERAVARLTDAVVSGSLAHASGEFDSLGYGAMAPSGGKVVVTRALFERNRGNAISAWSSSTASVTYACDRDGQGGYSFDLDWSAIGEASHLVTLRAVSGSVWAFRGGQATIEHVYVQRSGGGLYARLGGRIDAERVLLEDNAGVGVESSGTSNVTIADATIRDQSVNGTDTGQGMLVIEAALTADRAQIVRATGFAIDVRGTEGFPGAATLSDINITQVRPRNPNTLSFNCTADGSGVRARERSSVRLFRGLFEGGAKGIGISSVDQHTIEDVMIRGPMRTGLCVVDGTYNVKKLWIEGATGRGIDVFGAYVETSDLAVIGTERYGAEEATGVGILLAGRNTIDDVRIATLPLTSFLLSGNEARGLVMENGSEAMLREGEIEGSEIGIELINQPGLDLSELYQNVIFRNNGTIVMFR